MAVFADIVFAEGRVDITEDGTACALWLSVPADDDHADEEGPVQLREAVDPDNVRVELVVSSPPGSTPRAAPTSTCG